MEVRYWAKTISKILYPLMTEKILKNLKRIDLCLALADMVSKSDKQLLNYNLRDPF